MVCLTEAQETTQNKALNTKHEHVYGFQTVDGELYLIPRTRHSEALFADARLREKELLLKGESSGKGKDHRFTVDRIRSLKNGVVCDLFYFCAICNIETISPGPCECCQGAVELIEKPLGK